MYAAQECEKSQIIIYLYIFLVFLFDKNWADVVPKGQNSVHHETRAVQCGEPVPAAFFFMLVLNIYPNYILFRLAN